MAVFAIGDIQGCFDDLQRLLDAIEFNPETDQLWFTGDLVNRGPQSLQTLRFVKGLGDAAVSVLGNHDLHLLAVSCKVRKLHKKDALHAVLDAPDAEELLDWLRHRPLMYQQNNYHLIHAGLPPQWDIGMARVMAQKAEQVLRSENYHDFFQHMYGNSPDRWSDQLEGYDLIRFIINCFTRMRYCDKDGCLDFEHNNKPGTQPEHLMPWFKVPGRKSANAKLIFGHWSTLGYYYGENCYAIDTGCLWGGRLTALCIGEKNYSVAVDCPCQQQPGK